MSQGNITRRQALLAAQVRHRRHRRPAPDALQDHARLAG
jgi:hypothetical protein